MRWLIASTFVVIFECSTVPAFAGQPNGAVPAPTVTAQDERCHTSQAPVVGAGQLPHTSALLAARKPLTVVALGSSSTQGYGASGPDRSYPAQLAAILKARFSQSAITVINMGVGGDNIEDMLARLPAVLAQKPDLVIWQTGTNDAIRHLPAARFQTGLLDGLHRLRQRGIDVLLMTPQFAPQVVAAPNYSRYIDMMREAGTAEKIGVFRRFVLSQAWSTDRRFAGVPVTGPDGLHPTDAAYRCTAVLLAESIVRTVKGPSTATPSTH